MKITGIETWLVDVPYIEPVRKVNWGNPPFLIVRMSTDEGLTGLGEAWGGNREAIESAARGYVGQDPLSLALRALERPIQSALYDIVGKARGLPAHRLIGDLVR